MPTPEQIDAELQRREQLKAVQEEMQKRGMTPEEGEAVTPGQFVSGEFGTAAQIGRGTIEQLRDQLLRLIPKMPAIPATKKLPPSQAITPERPTFPEAPPTAPTKIGRSLGDILGFLGAGAAGGAGIAALPESVIRRVLQAAPGRIAGTALYGQAVSPEDRLRGAATGAALGAGAEAIPAIAGLRKYISPQSLTDSIMGYLKGGKSYEENTKGLAQDIKNAFENKKGEASDLYNSFFGSTGNNSIYGKLINSPEFYKGMDKNVFDSYLPDTKKIHNEFIQNPMVKNAHDLQSQLGFEVRKLENQPVKSIADTKDMQNWRMARDNLRQDVGTFLDLKDKTGDLSHMYDDATDHYRDNVAPYFSNSNIAKIATGKITNPKNVSNIFKFPSEDIAKVADDIGNEGKKKILYAEIGKQPKITPEKLISEINKLENKGLSDYITPTLQNSLDKLPTRIAAKTAAQRLAGLGAGLAIAPHAGIAPEILAGAGGAAITPTLMKTLRRGLPIEQVSRGIGTAYPWLSKAAIAALLGGQ